MIPGRSLRVAGCDTLAVPKIACKTKSAGYSPAWLFVCSAVNNISQEFILSVFWGNAVLANVLQRWTKWSSHFGIFIFIVTVYKKQQILCFVKLLGEKCSYKELCTRKQKQMRWRFLNLVLKACFFYKRCFMIYLFWSRIPDKTLPCNSLTFICAFPPQSTAAGLLLPRALSDITKNKPSETVPQCTATPNPSIWNITPFGAAVIICPVLT